MGPNSIVFQEIAGRGDALGGGQGLGDVLPNPELAEVGVDKGMEREQTHHGQRLDGVFCTEAHDMGTNGFDVDHERHCSMFRFCDAAICMPPGALHVK